MDIPRILVCKRCYKISGTALVFLFLILSSTILSAAQSFTTSDPNTSGWKDTRYIDGYKADPKKNASGPILEVIWKGPSTNCPPCQSLVQKYNAVMTRLMKARYTERVYRYHWATPKSSLPGAFIDLLIGTLGEDVSTEMQILDALNKKQKYLATVAQKLRLLIANCEKQCVDETISTTGIAIGGLPAIKDADAKKTIVIPNPELPIVWKGPYPEVCIECRKLAARLNEIPDMIRERQFQIWLNEIESKYQIGTVTLVDNIDELNRLSNQIHNLKENFKATLKVYSKCIESCPKKISYDDDQEWVAIGDPSSQLLGVGNLSGTNFIEGIDTSPQAPEIATTNNKPKKPEPSINIDTPPPPTTTITDTGINQPATPHQEPSPPESCKQATIKNIQGCTLHFDGFSRVGIRATIEYADDDPVSKCAGTIKINVAGPYGYADSESVSIIPTFSKTSKITSYGTYTVTIGDAFNEKRQPVQLDGQKMLIITVTPTVLNPEFCQ